MLLIDRLIHGFHYHQRFGPTRAVAVTLIEGRLREARQEWRTTIDAAAETWRDERLRRKVE